MSNILLVTICYIQQGSDALKSHCTKPDMSDRIEVLSILQQERNLSFALILVTHSVLRDNDQ